MEIKKEILKNDINKIEQIIQQSLLILNKYKFLLNASVVDFCSENHWSTLPKSWSEAFSEFEPDQLDSLFELKPKNQFPLSLLCVRVLLKHLCISRSKQTNQLSSIPSLSAYTHPKLQNTLSKHIKPKKRHEINQMSVACAQAATANNVQYIVDFGSGLGHLSRVIAYKYGLHVCCLEQQQLLTTQAMKIDDRLEQIALKSLPANQFASFRRPVHLNFCLTKKTTAEEFLLEIITAFGIDDDAKHDFKFGIIGLHLCGDLTSILLKLFLKCNGAIFLNIVGCCYQKMSCLVAANNNGFPLSSFLSKEQLDLTAFGYNSRDIACHAQEIFLKRIKNKDFNYLKVHSYRAALEKIIVSKWPHLKHSGLRNISYSNDLTFAEYCRIAVSHLCITIPDEEIWSQDTQDNLNNWRKVIIFYTLRIFLGPLVESVILYDGLLFLLENGCVAEIEAIFDPELSPRNQMLKASKNVLKR